MPIKSGEWKIVEEIKVGDKGLEFMVTQLNGNPIQVNLVRVRENGKQVAARRIDEELSELMKVLPSIQKILDEDKKRIELASAAGKPVQVPAAAKVKKTKKVKGGKPAVAAVLPKKVKPKKTKKNPKISKPAASSPIPADTLLEVPETTDINDILDSL